MKKQKNDSGKLLAVGLSGTFLLFASGFITECFQLPALYVCGGAVFLSLIVLFICLSGGKDKENREEPELSAEVAEERERFLSDISQPAAICDETGTVLWANAAFYAARGSEDGVGVKLGELCPKVGAEDLFLENINAAALGDGIYRYEFASVPGNEREKLVLFSDVTALNEYTGRVKEEKTAVAYVAIDNVEELLQYVQEKFRSAVSEVETILMDWAVSMNGIIRLYERDKYIMLFDYRHLEECVENRFAVLDSIRNIRVGDGIPVTVSVGVSCAEGSLTYREEMAKSALDMALQRGGDQVVYKYDGGTECYGGKTKAVHKRANVKARVMGSQIAACVGKADNVVIMGHCYGDYDSFGAAVGMARFCMFFGTKVNIVANRSSSSLRSCFDLIDRVPDYDDVFVSNSEAAVLVTPKTLLILVDVNNFPHTECPKLMGMTNQIIVVDHHTQTSDFPKEPILAYIEPSASSASEMVAEILEHNLTTKRLLKEEADALLSGILLDTKQLSHNTGTRTLGAAMFLRGEGADPADIGDFFKSDVEELMGEAKFFSHIIVYRESLAIAVCDGEADESYSVIAAKVADKLLTGKGIRGSFALVVIGGKVRISARSDGTLNVAKILEELHGGGHFDAAGASLEGQALEIAVQKLKLAIDKYIE
ncbi:MAG: DHH family phosphoesterase [Clostridia bacterium]|nr:DHH family phosphoesterase [Clostridia bacterium]